MAADGAGKPPAIAATSISSVDSVLVVSVTVHDGVIRSVLRVTGHRPWEMQTGGVIPLLIKASVRKEIEGPQS